MCNITSAAHDPTTPVAAGAFCQGRLKTQTMALAGPEI
jgi:hypothetical protein